MTQEKKSLISSLIKEIEIFPCDESELPLKSILFNFPVYKDGGDVYEFLWDKSTHVSTWHEMRGVSIQQLSVLYSMQYPHSQHPIVWFDKRLRLLFQAVYVKVLCKIVGIVELFSNYNHCFIRF